ncbi:TPA: hypothetical protein ACSP3K_002689, partial [Aeromonas veronii]
IESLPEKGGFFASVIFVISPYIPYSRNPLYLQPTLFICWFESQCVTHLTAIDGFIQRFNHD